MEDKIVLGKQFWGPFILQALVLLGAGWGYATAQEHRITVIEEALKNQSQVLLELSTTQRIQADQMRDIQRTQDKMVALGEKFVRATRDR